MAGPNISKTASCGHPEDSKVGVVMIVMREI